MKTKQRIIDGTEVSWQSQAAGSFVKKTGIIEAFVPQKADVRDIWKVLRPDKKFEYGAISQPTSRIPRYLIRVERQGKTKAFLKDKYYCPSASVIEKQNPDAQRS